MRVHTDNRRGYSYAMCIHAKDKSYRPFRMPTEGKERIRVGFNIHFRLAEVDDCANTFTLKGWFFTKGDVNPDDEKKALSQSKHAKKGVR
eukprot:g23900.t1